MGDAADDAGVESRARDVGDVAALPEMGLLVGDDPDILKERMALGDGPHGVLVTVRDAERADPVVARADGHDGQQHLVGPHLLLDEEPVDHLVQRAVASDHDDAAVSLPHGRHRELRRVELVFGEDRLAEDVRVAQILRDLREIVEPAAPSGHGIDDDEPLVGLHCRQGILRSVCVRKS